MTAHSIPARAALGAFALGLTLLTPLTAAADVGESPPEINITSPAEGDSFDGPSATVDVSVDVTTEFTALSSLAITVDGETVATQDGPEPYDAFTITLDAGMHELVAVGTQSGVEFSSDPVNVVVFGADDAADESKGCKIAPGDDPTRDLGLGLVLVFGLGALIWRRRDAKA